MVVVVVVGGYDEPEAEFLDPLEQSLSALRGAGVKRVGPPSHTRGTCLRCPES